MVLLCTNILHSPCVVGGVAVVSVCSVHVSVHCSCVSVDVVEAKPLRIPMHPLIAGNSELLVAQGVTYIKQRPVW